MSQNLAFLPGLLQVFLDPGKSRLWESCSFNLLPPPLLQSVHCFHAPQEWKGDRCSVSAGGVLLLHGVAEGDKEKAEETGPGPVPSHAPVSGSRVVGVPQPAPS